MPYLILQDYYSRVQNTDLQQLISNEEKYRLQAQKVALAEMKGYLAQKYDIVDEFRETLAFSYTSTYQAKQLVYLDATAYSAVSAYALNDLTLQGGNVYYCKVAIIAPGEAFNVAHWTLLGAQYDLFYVTIPYEEFNHEGTYSVDEVVFRNNKIYTCLRDTLPLSQSSKLQYGEYSQVPGSNEYPDAASQSQWSEGVSYSFSGIMPKDTSVNYTAWSGITAYVAGQKVSRNSLIWLATADSTNVEPGTDITKWALASYTEGDNRNPRLVEMNVLMSLYKLSPRISPYNVPEVWVKNYDDCCRDLKRFAKGELTLDMPQNQPAKGRINWGSTVRNINNY
jgi:hypothetical protein